jgi:hypothetical protein
LIVDGQNWPESMRLLSAQEAVPTTYRWHERMIRTQCLVCRTIVLYDEIATVYSFAMHFIVFRLRDEGKPVRRWMANRTPLGPGTLLVSEEHDAVLSRTTTLARMQAIRARDRDLVPRLVDARLLWVNYEGMALTGFERIGERDYAQSWIVEFVPDDKAKA